MRFGRDETTEVKEFTTKFGLKGKNIFYNLEATPTGKFIKLEVTDAEAIAWLRAKNIPEAT